jgi:hypothetical protein
MLHILLPHCPPAAGCQAVGIERNDCRNQPSLTQYSADSQPFDTTACNWPCEDIGEALPMHTPNAPLAACRRQLDKPPGGLPIPFRSNGQIVLQLLQQMLANQVYQSQFRFFKK